MPFLYVRSGNRDSSHRPWIAMVSLTTALSAGILGCNLRRNEPAVEVHGATEAGTQTQEAQQPIPAPAPIKEQTLEEQPFRIEELSAREQNGQTIIRVIFSKPVAQYRHFTLGQPARIIVDVFGEAQRLPKGDSFRIDTHWAGSLRLNSSDGYLRLTTEIAAATVPSYEIEPEDSGLRLVIGAAKPDFIARKELDLVRAGKRVDMRAAEAKPTGSEGGAGAPAFQPAPAEEIRYTGQRISLDFKDADIKNVFRLLADISGLNLVVTGDVQKRVTLRLIDVPWDQALDLLIDTNGLGKTQVGNVVRISTAAQIKAEKDALAAAKKAEENLEDLQTVYLSVNYAKVKELDPKIKPLLSSRGTVVFDERSNTIFVRDIKKSLDEINSLVSKLDTRTPQVLIESNLIETTPTFARALGMQLQFEFGNTQQITSTFPAGLPFVGGMPFLSIMQAKAGPFKNLNVQLSAAESEGNIKIISRPSVVTLNNVASTIQSLRILRVALPASTNIASGSGSAAGTAVATEKIPVGIILTVTPQVSSDGFVLLNISVKSSSLGTQSPGSVVPDELSREAIANVLVRDGETIVLGGIMKDTKATNEGGIPYLKDIPGFGWLFKNIRWQKDFEELMVFITPRIVSAGSENLPTAEKLWREQMKRTEGS
jgi:type II secretory pathway component GspD/PulD (secretin)